MGSLVDIDHFPVEKWLRAMKHIWNHALSLALVGGSAAWVCAQDQPAAPAPPAKATRTELRDKQFDVVLDARDIERILTRLKRASELSKQRMTDAAAAAESVSTAIDRGDAVSTRQRADDTAKMFQEIVQQLEALLSEETPQRIAAARNLAAQLSKAEQQFAQQAQMLAQQMQSAPATATGGTNQNPPDPTRPTSGQGRPRSPDDPMKTESPKGNATGQEKPKEPQPNGASGSGERPDKDDPEKKSGSGARQPSPTDAEKPPEGNGTGQEKPKEPQPNGAGGSGERSEKDDPQQKGGDGGGARQPLTPQQRQEQLANRADDLANRAATLLDILEAIAKSEDPADRDAAGKVGAMLKETNLKEALDGMATASEQIRNRKFEDAQSAALDMSERLQIATQRLDAVYRAIVGPQAEELRKLEQLLLQLQENLNNLQTPAQVAAWHRAVRELLDKADELGISDTRRNELLEEMKKQGFSLTTGAVAVDWQLTDGRYAAPATYSTRLVALQEEIQSKIQTLLVGEFASMTDDRTPPQYQNFVERYYQVLSRDSGKNTPASTEKSKSPEKK